MKLLDIIDNLLQPKVTYDEDVKPKVLIVEDDDAVRSLWSEVLRHMCTIELASSNTEAFEALRENPGPDILILDWVVANGKATAVLNTWLSTTNNPCCVVSGRLTSEDMTNLYRRGVMHVLQKPVDIDIVASIVRQYVVIIKQKLELRTLRQEVRLIKRNMVFLVILLFAVVAGQNIVQYLAGLLL